jgi:hypothetical protein
MTNEELQQEITETVLMNWGHLTWFEYLNTLTPDVIKYSVGGTIIMLGISLDQTLLETRGIIMREALTNGM